MKPRLEPMRLTEEDSWIWHIVSARFDATGPGFRFTSLWTPALNGDRRDADLMLHLVELREQGDCYLRLKIGVHWCNVIVPPVQVYIRKNPLWPCAPQAT